MPSLIALLPLVSSLLFHAVPKDARLNLLDAMAEELARNQKRLKLQNHPPPYFISYEMKDVHQAAVGGRYGAVFEDDIGHERRIYADVRVGSYEFDSSISEDMDFNLSTKGTSFSARKNGPVDDNPDALRNALWLITDERYKAGVFNLLKKQGENVYTVDDPKRAASFTREAGRTFIQPPLASPFSHARWETLVRSLSLSFKDSPAIFDSDVRVTQDRTTRYFVSSEGARIVTEDVTYGVHVFAVTRAADGQLLDNSRDYYAPTEEGLPSDGQLSAVAKKIVAELIALRAAPSIDPYTGPAILESEAAGVLFHEAVGHRLEGDRQDNDSEGKTFHGQVGKPLLPPFLSLVDDPTLRSIGNQPLNGFYSYDDEGVAASRVTLVDRGILKNFLVSRHPVEGFTHSNGHGRSQLNRKPVARMANLIVSSTRQVSDRELKKMLVAEAKRQGKPYGLIIRDITGGNTNTSSYGYQAFKGMPRMVYRVDVADGKETLVRGVEVVGTPLTALNKIMATGNHLGIFNGYCGAESGMVPVSTVAPPTLLQEIELQRVVEGKDRPPVLSSPWSQ